MSQNYVVNRVEPRTVKDSTRFAALATLTRKMAERATALHKSELATTPLLAVWAKGQADAFDLMASILQEESRPNLDVSMVDIPSFVPIMLGAMDLVTQAVRARRNTNVYDYPDIEDIIADTIESGEVD